MTYDPFLRKFSLFPYKFTLQALLYIHFAWRALDSRLTRLPAAEYPGAFEYPMAGRVMPNTTAGHRFKEIEATSIYDAFLTFKTRYGYSQASLWNAA